MARENFRKIKLLKLLEMLRQNTDEQHPKCVASVKVQISPVFWGWLFQFSGAMKIISPTHVIETYKNMASHLLSY